MKKRKKYSLTLLEVVIAVAITSILLSTLWQVYFSWYNGYLSLQENHKVLYRKIFIKERLEITTAYIRSQNKPSSLVSLHEDMCIFRYQNGPDADLAFNGAVSSTLFIDESGYLLLLTKGKEDKERKEVLATGISSISIEFFNPKNNLWEKEWPENREYLPLWLRITLKYSKTEESFYFRTALLKDPILYIEQIERR